MDTYGRNRDSLADIQDNLEVTFSEHPDKTTNSEGEECVPVRVVPQIISSLASLYDGLEIINAAEMDTLRAFAENEVNHDLLVTPTTLVSLIAGLTKSSPSDSPEMEGRELELADGNGSDGQDVSDSRSAGNESFRRSSSSRPPSRGPPQTPKNSVFDTHRRQRSTPLGNAPPSTWSSRPAPPSRRKSDAGNRSDGESGSYPRSLSRTRSRAPSNPTSPSTQLYDLHPSVGSPTFGGYNSRPSSRVGRSRVSSYEDRDYSSPDDNHEGTATYNHFGNRDNSDFLKSLSSLPMPRSAESDSDEEDPDSLGLVMERNIASSTASMEPQERVEALVKATQDWQQRAGEADRSLRRKMEEHENEIENYQIRLDELSTELAASKREDKDLRNKDRQSQTAIVTLEGEVAKLTKQLETSRVNYASLQKSYQEQCAVSETYRVDLRQRDERIRILLNSQSASDAEAEKFRRESEAYEQRLAEMQVELENTQPWLSQLEEQKQENLLLKETIDRMRFDMDELRNNLATATLGGPSSGTNSAANTISKSLGAELANRLKDGWGSDEETEEDEDEDADTSTETTIVDDDDEDIIQTVITRRKKVASRANKIETILTREEVKEYSDSSVQYEPELFLATTSSQTIPEPVIVRSSFSVQTEPVPEFEPQLIVRVPTPPPQRVTAEMQVQTEPEAESQPPHPEEATASSSTATPSISKADQSMELPFDQPPAYNQVTEEHDWQVAADTLKKWHAGVKLPLEGIPNGVTPEAIAEWKALKEELGVECNVIEKIIGKSGERTHGDEDTRGKNRRRSRFYNIYNTYVYGAGDGSGPSRIVTAYAMAAAGTAMLVFAVGPYFSSESSGGATAFDRAAWSSYNSLQGPGEGFLAPDGASTVWNFLGRISGGAARAARGFPT